MPDEQIVPAQEDTLVANDETSTEDVEATVDSPEEVIDPELEVPTVYSEPVDEQTSPAEDEEQPQEEKVAEETPDEEPIQNRLKGAVEAVEKKNKELQKMVELQSELIQDSPELIHKIAERDPQLADRVISKVWGDQGVKSYKQLLERAKLEELKESNPDLYETKRELAEMKAKLMERQEKEQQALHDKFFKDKGITPNEYDPNYKSVNESLKLINPGLIEENYGQALELAYNMTFAKARPMKTVQAPTLNVGGGQAPRAIPVAANNAPTEQSAWLADGLNRLGYNIKF